MTIRAVLFDWGGTLVRDDRTDEREPAVSVAAYARERLGMPVRDEDFERAFEAALPGKGDGNPAPDVGKLIGAAFTWLGWSVGTNDVDACARRFFDAATRGQTVYDDARALLPSLRYRGYRTAVVANELFGAGLFGTQVNALGLSGYIDAFVTSADTGFAKPKPEIFQSALKAIGVEPFEALFVGDSVALDVAGARGAGMRAVHLERRDRSRDAAGYLVIERLGALTDILGDGMVRDWPGA